MKLTILTVLLAVGSITASAQAPAKPASDAKPAAAATTAAQSPAKPASDAKPAAADVKPLPHLTPVEGVRKPLFTVTLSCQDIKIGAGAAAEPKKLLKYYFTLWLASDGRQLDTTDERRTPLLDNNKKPVLDENGKPKMGDPQPATMMMGTGRPLPGWDLGFEGMKVGGKRRVYIPWQLGLGNREAPARDANHPAVPAKSDLILDLELLDVSDAPPPPTRPNMMPGQHPAPGASPKLTPPATPPAVQSNPAAPVTKPAAPATPVTKPAAPATPPAAAQPQSK